MSDTAQLAEEQHTHSESAHREIARRAYERFLARGATHGQDVDDWLHAEREMCNTHHDG